MYRYRYRSSVKCDSKSSMITDELTEMEPLAPSTPSCVRDSFDDVYRANGSELLSTASSPLSARKLATPRPADADAHADDDASMSNDDDAMSETSSLEIDDARDSATLAAIALDNEAMELLLDETGEQTPSRHRERPASFHGVIVNPLDAVDDTPPRMDGVPRAASLGAFTPSSLWAEVDNSAAAGTSFWPLSPRKRKRKVTWLHAHFASAMSKSVQRTEPLSQLVDEGEDDDLMNGVRVESPEAAANESRGSRFPKVEWAHEEARHVDRDGVRLVSARNQVVGTQLRVHSNQKFQLTVDRSNWFLPQGHARRCRVHVETSFLPQALQVQVFLVGFVEDERNERVMETLDKRSFSRSVAYEHAVYVRVRVGATIPDGNYEIPVRLFTQNAGFTDEELSWTTQINLHVANVTLSAPTQWAFHLDLWQHPTSIARAHGVPLWSESHFVLIDRYFQPLSELGQKCVTIVATEMPWAGQQCYAESTYPSALFEHAVLEVYEDGKTADGTLSIDFQYFDKLLALAEKHHMDREIEVFGLFSIWADPAYGFDSPVEPSEIAAPSDSSQTASNNDRKASSGSHASKPLDNWRIRCVHRTTQRVRYLKTMAEIESFITLFYEHCVSRGLVDRVRICADEPSDVSVFYAQMAFLERLAPRFQLKVALNHLDFLTYAPQQVVDFVPLLPLVCADLEVTTRWKSQIRELKKGKFCWYVCCGPSYPNQFVSSPLAESELVGFLTHFLGLDGFLRWNFCLWPANPWQNLKWRSPMWKVGDMYFVLPGHDGHPVETLRFEAMRFAVQSYELLQLAKRKLSEAEFARLEGDVASLIWRSAGHAQFGQYLDSSSRKAAEDLYSLEPEDYERSRRLVLDALALATTLDPQSQQQATTPSMTPSPPPADSALLSPPRQLP